MDITQQSEIISSAVAVQDIELTALLPSEMVESQKQLIDWCVRKIANEQMQANELQEAYEHAKRMKWKSGPLQRQANLAVKRVEYYGKVKGALEAGYYIVPNFPIEIFAIRTDRKKPLKMFSTSQWGKRREQEAKELPLGEGEYKNPFPLVQQENETIDGKNYYQSWAEEWDQFEFPINMAKPQIMDVTNVSMQRKIFDRIGVMPPIRRRKKNEYR